MSNPPPNNRAFSNYPMQELEPLLEVMRKIADQRSQWFENAHPSHTLNPLILYFRRTCLGSGTKLDHVQRSVKTLELLIKPFAWNTEADQLLASYA